MRAVERCPEQVQTPPRPKRGPPHELHAAPRRRPDRPEVPPGRERPRRDHRPAVQLRRPHQLRPHRPHRPCQVRHQQLGARPRQLPRREPRPALLPLLADRTAHRGVPGRRPSTRSPWSSPTGGRSRPPPTPCRWRAGPGAARSRGSSPSSRPRKGGPKQDSEFIIWGVKGTLDNTRDLYLPGHYIASQPRKGRVHITQKPVEVMQQLVQVCPEGGTVLDPFTGSGSTGVAALREGRQLRRRRAVRRTTPTSPRSGSAPN